MPSRREFLKTGSLVCAAPLVPRMLVRAAGQTQAERDAPVLVVIQLDGGNDGINTVVAHQDDGYARARNKLRLDAAKLHLLNDHVALHPSMQEAKRLFDAGDLAIVQGVGYPNPDRSHFRSMKIWQTARFDEEEHDGYGWLGRALDAGRSTADRLGQSSAVYVGEQETPVALWGRRSQATSLSRPDDLHLQMQPALPPRRLETAADETLAQFVYRQSQDAFTAAADYARQQNSAGAASTAKYPDTPLAARLQLISSLLMAGSPARVYYTMQPGYDTHAAQLYSHARLLREFSGALAAFVDDLKQTQLDQRVVVLAFSEFGRRVKENASQGTDHGTAGPVFLAGGPVRGGLFGDAPSLTDLDGGDIKSQFDFRQLYAPILEEWLGVGSMPILGGEFDPVPVLAV